MSGPDQSGDGAQVAEGQGVGLVAAGGVQDRAVVGGVAVEVQQPGQAGDQVGAHRTHSSVQAASWSWSGLQVTCRSWPVSSKCRTAAPIQRGSPSSVRYGA